MNAAKQHVVEVLPVEWHRKWAGLGEGRIRVPDCPQDALLCRLTVSPEGGQRVEPITGEPGASVPGIATDRIARLRQAVPVMVLAFPKVAQDNAGHAWDLLFTAALAVTEARLFLKVALPLTGVGMPLEATGVGNWLSDKLAHLVRDALRESGQSIEALIGEHALPDAWWETRLNEWLSVEGIGGLRLTAVKVRWESASATRAEAEANERQERERRIAATEAETAARIRAATAEADEMAKLAEVDERLRQLEHDKALTNTARKEQLDEQESELRHRRAEREQALARQRLLHERELNDLRRANERACIEHDLAMAGMSSDLSEAKRLGELRARMETEQRARDEEIDRRTGELQTAEARVDRLLERQTLLASFLTGNSREINRAAALAIKLGFTARDFLALGYSSRHVFAGLMGLKAAEDGEVIALRMKNLGQQWFNTRDIGGGADWNARLRLETVCKGDSLEFSLRSRLPGFVTVINPGTSGCYWLQVPNREVGSPLIEAGREYWVPGPELLPLEWVGEYYEDGQQQDWEHLVVIVSREPLVDEATVRRASPVPFVELQPADLDRLLCRFDEWQPEEWAAATRSFLVT